jgi:hypothetical protein
MKSRRRTKQNLTLQDRLAAWSREVRDQAAQLPPGPERDAMLKRASQAETAAHLDDWASSPGLRPPSKPV